MADPSFALNQRQAVGPGNTPDPVMLNAPAPGRIVGGIPNPTAVTGAPPVLDQLARIGNDLLAPAIKRKQEQEFLEGMRRVAAGEAAAEIEEERPEWARFFGDAPAALGARAYEAAHDANALEIELTTNMDTYRREMTSEQFRDHIGVLMTKMKSGDPVRDAAMAQSLLQMAPGLMKAHAKERLRYEQEVAFDARGKHIRSTMEAFEVQAERLRGADSPRAQAERTAAVERLLANLAPGDGENPEWAEKQTVASLLAMITEGKFDTVNALRESGAFAALPLEAQDQLNNAIRVNGNRAIWERMAPRNPEFMANVSRFFTDPPRDPNAVSAMADFLNRQARAESGVPVDIISGQDVVRAIGTADQQAARADAERSKAEEEARTIGIISAAMRSGQPDAVEQAITVAGANGRQIAENLLAVAWEQAPTVDERVKLLRVVHKNKQFESSVRGWREGSGAYTAGFQEIASVAASYPGGVDAIAHYFQDHELSMLKEYQRLGRLQPELTPRELYDAAKAHGDMRKLQAPPPKNKEELAAFNTAVDSALDGDWLRFRNRVGKWGESAFRGVVALHYQNSPESDPRVAAQRAVARSRDTFKLVGDGFGYLDPQGRPPIHTMLNEGRGYTAGNMVGEAINAVVEERLGKLADQEDFGSPIRVADANGKFVIMVVANVRRNDDSGGVDQKLTYIHQDDVERMIRKRAADKLIYATMRADNRASMNDPMQSIGLGVAP